MNREEMFAQIFKINGFQGTESKSGPGSDNIQTKTIKEEIVKLCKEFSIKSFIDAPCGDVMWFQYIWPELDGQLEKYLGCDIVKDIIGSNNFIFEDLKFNTFKPEFKQLDLVVDPLPEGDLLLCRDCLVHLSLASALQFLDNFRKSNITYLLTTTFTRKDRVNYNYPDGTGWFPISLNKYPFNLPQPIKIINENCTEGNMGYTDKSLALYRREDLITCGV